MKKTLLVSLLFSLTAPLWADSPEKEPPKIPAGRDFIRSLELDGGVISAGSEKRGAQFFRIETRYFDSDAQAFVGLIAMMTRFNEVLKLADQADPYEGHAILNWGAAIGMVRGRHLWAIDLMGANLNHHLAFGPAIVGEHSFGKHWKIFHRTAGDFFAGDTVLDSDQGLLWAPKEWIALTLGYRVFASAHDNRNGPRVGLLLRFNVPKMPFIFPSIG